MTLTDMTIGTYRIDPARSVCRFTATHVFGLKPVAGTMAVTGGTISVAEDPEHSIASAELDATSFATDDPRRGQGRPGETVPGHGPASGDRVPQHPVPPGG